MLDFIGSALFSAMIAWSFALVFEALGIPSFGAMFGVAALLLSAIAVVTLIVAGLVWTIRHVRFTII